MDGQLILVVITYIVVFICMAVGTWIIVRRSNKQTDTLIAILNSFSSIDKDLGIITTKLENYDKHNEKSNDTQKTVIIESLKNISDRMEKLEKTTTSQVSKLDNDINRLYMYCSGRFVRDNMTKD